MDDILWADWAAIEIGSSQQLGHKIRTPGHFR